MSQSQIKNSTMELRAVNYASRFLNTFLSFYEESEFCDTVLIADIDNTKIHVHRIVLSASSDFFRTLFRNNLKATSTLDEVKVNAIEGVTLKLIVDFMYTGFIQLHNDTIKSVVEAAHFLQTHSLLTVCCNFIAQNTDVTNCLGVADFAEMYNLTVLAEKTIIFICKNFEKICAEKEFLNLNEQQLCRIISRDDICVQSHVQLFSILVSWINHDRETRGNSLLKIVKYVRFSSLTPEIITNNMLLLCNTTECYNFFGKWLQWHLSPEKRNELELQQGEPSKMLIEKLVVVGILGSLVVQTYNPDMGNSWSDNVIPQPPVRKSCFGIGVSNQKLVVAWAEIFHTSVYCFDFQTRVWCDLPSLRYGLVYCRFVEIIGNLYAYSKSSQYRYLERYDVNANTWQVMAEPPSNLISISIAVSNGLLYMSTDAGMKCYNPAADKWTNKTLPEENLKIAEVNGHLYAFGGLSQAFYCYYPLNDTWNISGSLAKGKYHSWTTLNNRLITLSWFKRKPILAEYDPETNESRTLPSPPDGLCGNGTLLTFKM